MTRLTHTTYILQHHQLRREWLNRHGFAFTMLSPTEQILIHDFYEPSKPLTDRELKAHREVITRARPSLPHQAGKAFMRIAPFLNVVPAPLRSPGRGKPYVVKIASLVSPHIDPARMAWILMGIVRSGTSKGSRTERPKAIPVISSITMKPNRCSPCRVEKVETYCLHIKQ